MTDPAEIDLDIAKTQLSKALEPGGSDRNIRRFEFCRAIAPGLIETVEALRERVADLQGLRERRLTQIMECEKKLDAIKSLALGNADDASFWKARAEAAEAHAVEFTGALEVFAGPSHFHNPLDADIPNDSPVTIRCQLGDVRRALVALATVPPQALERARAKDDFITEYRKYVAGGFRGDLGRRVDEAFNKLEALDPAEQGNR